MEVPRVGFPTLRPVLKSWIDLGLGSPALVRLDTDQASAAGPCYARTRPSVNTGDGRVTVASQGVITAGGQRGEFA